MRLIVDGPMPTKPAPLDDEEALTDPSAEARSSFGAAFERLVGVMARLRGDAGCPWDRAQDLASLRPFLLEETHEVLDAIDRGSTEDHREELGDLLLQVVFQAEIRRQEGSFDAADVAHGIADKLVRRHPHVFGEAEADSAHQAYRNWEAIKLKEKAGRSVLSGVPPALPALLRAQRVGEKASRVGFDWPDITGPLAKLEEELGELRAAMERGERREVEGELGDALFSLVNVARFAGVNAEDALRGTTERFSRRFAHLEAALAREGRAVSEATSAELDALWEEAKAEEARAAQKTS